MLYQYRGMYSYQSDIITKINNSPLDAPLTLYILDFDSTLFRSPLPSSKLWDKKLIGKITSELGWWTDIRSLNLVGEEGIDDGLRLCGPRFWNEDLISEIKALQINSNNLFIILTGRSTAFRQLIISLLNQSYPSLATSYVITKERVGGRVESTIGFKLKVIDYFLRSFPSIRHAELWEDREPHCKIFKDNFMRIEEEGRIKSGTVHHTVISPSEMDPDLEHRLVLDLIDLHNNRLPHRSGDTECNQKAFTLVEHISYTAIFLSPTSRSLIYSKYPTPQGHVTKTDHLTISFGGRDEELIDVLGGLDSEHTIIATHIGSYEGCTALKIDGTGIISKNETPHVTLYVSPSSSSKYSNSITDWTALINPISLTGVLGLKKVYGLPPTHKSFAKKLEVSIGLIILKYHDVKGNEIRKVMEFVNQRMEKEGVKNLEVNRSVIEKFVRDVDSKLLNGTGSTA